MFYIFWALFANATLFIVKSGVKMDDQVAKSGLPRNPPPQEWDMWLELSIELLLKYTIYRSFV